jgi:hypothetical protein
MGRWRPIREDLRLDLDLYRPLRRVMLGTTHDVNQTLDKIRRLLDKWSAGFEHGLLVLSPEDKRRRDREFRAWAEEEQAAEQAAAAQATGGAMAGTVKRLLRAAASGAVAARGMKTAEGRVPRVHMTWPRTVGDELRRSRFAQP